MVVVERHLHRVQLAVGEAFDRGDLCALKRHRKRRTAFHRLAIYMHHTGATLAGVTAHMGSRQAQVFTQENREQ